MQIRPLVSVVILLATALVVGACSDDAQDASSTTAPQLSAAAQEGQQVAEAEGCTSCHRTDGEAGVGPSWQGLAGSEVELDDGTVVVADEQYLTDAIVEPNAQIVDGYNGIMPERTLDADEVAAIVAYLQELGGDE